MVVQKGVDKFFNHWSRKLSAMILTYLAIITIVLNIIYPTLEGIAPSLWDKMQYSLIVILPFIVCLAVYIGIVLNKNKITSITHLLDIFPTYATFVRILAGFILVVAALFTPNLRVLAISYVFVILLVGSLSLKPLYYDITFRFIRVLVDIFLAALVVYYYGGIYSPFVLLFFIPITISARYFDSSPARGIAFFTVFIIFFVTFIDFNSNESFVDNYQQLVFPYITIVLLIFLVGEIIYAERRERIKPIHESLLRINKICKDNKPVNGILQELTNFLNSEIIIVVNLNGEYVACYSPIGDHGYHFREAVLLHHEHKKFIDWISEIDITAVSNFWDILHTNRRKLVAEASIFVAPFLDNNLIKNISSFIFTKLDEDKGYVIAINNKSANKILTKPFTPDRYELLTISSTVLDDHSFFEYNQIQPAL